MKDEENSAEADLFGRTPSDGGIARKNQIGQFFELRGNSLQAYTKYQNINDNKAKTYSS